MSNWNRLEPWRQGNSGCVCSPAVIFVLHHASSGFFLLLFFFIHNEIDSSCGRLQKIESQNEKKKRLSPAIFLFFFFSFFFFFLQNKKIFNGVTTLMLFRLCLKLHNNLFPATDSISTVCTLPSQKTIKCAITIRTLTLKYTPAIRLLVPEYVHVPAISEHCYLLHSM